MDTTTAQGKLLFSAFGALADSSGGGILIIVDVARTQATPNERWPAAAQLQSSNCPGGFPGRGG